MRETKVKLDRRRILRLTPCSIMRAEQELGSIAELGKRLAKGRQPDDVVRLFWVLLVDDDPTLTPVQVKEILERRFLGGWRWLKDRQFSRVLSQAQRLGEDIAADLNGAKEN